MLQLESLYTSLQSIKLREFEIQASLHGVQLDNKPSNLNANIEAQEHPDVPLFRDPSEYSDMNDEELEKETQRMMDKHKRWSGDALNK